MNQLLSDEQQRLLIRYAAQVQTSGCCAYPELDLHLRQFHQLQRQSTNAQTDQQQASSPEIPVELVQPPGTGQPVGSTQLDREAQGPQPGSQGSQDPFGWNQDNQAPACNGADASATSANEGTDWVQKANVVDLASHQPGKPPLKSAARRLLAASRQSSPPLALEPSLAITPNAAGRDLDHRAGTPDAAMELGNSPLLQRFRATVQSTGQCDHPELADRLATLYASSILEPGDCGEALIILLQTSSQRLQCLRQSIARNGGNAAHPDDSIVLTGALRHLQQTLTDGLRSFGDSLHQRLRQLIRSQLKRAEVLLRSLERGHRHQHSPFLLQGLQINLLETLDFVIAQWQTAIPA